MPDRVYFTVKEKKTKVKTVIYYMLHCIVFLQHVVPIPYEELS